MRRQPPRPARPPVKRYLNEPYIVERTRIEQAMEALRPLSNATMSPLPARMRHATARMLVALSGYLRELHHHPDAIGYERADEDRSTSPLDPLDPLEP